MNVISAQEIKRRGVIALEEALQQDPVVHILKNNRPVCVVLREEKYNTLDKQVTTGDSLLDWMLSKPATGQETPDSIAQRIRSERNKWD